MLSASFFFLYKVLSSAMLTLAVQMIYVYINDGIGLAGLIFYCFRILAYPLFTLLLHRIFFAAMRTTCIKAVYPICGKR